MTVWQNSRAAKEPDLVILFSSILSCDVRDCSHLQMLETQQTIDFELMTRSRQNLCLYTWVKKDTRALNMICTIVTVTI